MLWLFCCIQNSGKQSVPTLQILQPTAHHVIGRQVMKALQLLPFMDRITKITTLQNEKGRQFTSDEGREICHLLLCRHCFQRWKADHNFDHNTDCDHTIRDCTRNAKALDFQGLGGIKMRHVLSAFFSRTEIRISPSARKRKP
jgi:hypothetical protein